MAKYVSVSRKLETLVAKLEKFIEENKENLIELQFYQIGRCYIDLIKHPFEKYCDLHHLLNCHIKPNFATLFTLYSSNYRRDSYKVQTIRVYLDECITDVEQLGDDLCRIPRRNKRNWNTLLCNRSSVYTTSSTEYSSNEALNVKPYK